VDDIAEEWGTNKLGMETVPQVITRGVLLDVAALRHVQRLEKGYVITPQDIEAALRRQALEVRRGTVLLFHTGWGELWMADNAAYVAGEPGPGMDAALWMDEHGVVMTGCDTWSFGPVPPEDRDEPFVVPQSLNAKYGLFVMENLRTAELSRDSIYEFMFVLSHAKVRGATGAWVCPIAVV
jgi:kynurenine formamidase